MINLIIQSIKQSVLPQKNIRIFKKNKIIKTPISEGYLKADEECNAKAIFELAIYKLKKISPRGKCLDVGCGSGKFLVRLAEEFPEIEFTGIDSSGEMLKLAKKKIDERGFNNVKLKKLNPLKLNRIKEKFDLITCNFFLHNLKSEFQALNFINSLLKLLKKRGVLFFFDMTRPKNNKIALFLADKYNKKFGKEFYEEALNLYRASFSFYELKDILKKTNWKNYEHEQPLIGNFFQFVCTKKQNKKILFRPRLKNFEQKINYYLLKFFWKI